MTGTHQHTLVAAENKYHQLGILACSHRSDQILSCKYKLLQIQLQLDLVELLGTMFGSLS